MNWQDDEQLRTQLLALADGELPREQTAIVLTYLSEHPEAARWLVEQVETSSAVRRELLLHADPAPTSLRQSITSMKVGQPTLGRRIHLNWLAAAAAALLVGWLIFSPHKTAVGPIDSARVLPAAIVAHASRVHDDCSRVAEVSEKLHGEPFPNDTGPLARNIERDLHSDQPRPDLSPLGFHFVGAGPCGDPLPDAIHLLYHSDRPNTNRTISAFVQPYTGQYSLQLGRVYTVSDDASPFPMLAWRSESVVYFLLADDPATAQAALKFIHRSDALVNTK